MPRQVLIVLLALCLQVLLPCRFSAAESDDGVLRLCSQNLFRYGERGKKQAPKRIKQRDYLVTRFVQSKCDVVAVQEVTGKDKTQARRVLQELAEAYQQRIGEPVSVFVGESKDEHIRNGYLLLEKSAIVESFESLGKSALPRLQVLGPPAYFIRDPLQLVLTPRKGVSTQFGQRKLVVLNFHLKSKSRSWKDPTRTDFELLRMQMAEGLRVEAERQRKELGDKGVVVLLGDRNSLPDSASADILTGDLYLSDFQSRCRLSENQSVFCQTPPERRPEFIEVFEERMRRTGTKSGSYRYKGQSELIDGIVLHRTALHYLTREDGSLAIGYRGQFYRGSDHLLLWIELR